MNRLINCLTKENSMNQYMQAPQGIAQQQKDYGTEVIVDGRIVWGGLSLQPKKNFTTKQEEINPKTGQKVMQIAFGLAVPKPNPQSTAEEVDNFNRVWTAIHTEAGKQGFQWPNPKFAFKFTDGDGTKDDGSAYPAHSHGHIVLSISTQVPLTIFKRNPDGSFTQITDKDIKCGDYVRVNLNIKGHPAPNAGLYLNPAGVAFLEYGDAIVASANPTTLFGNVPFAMPAGASPTPVGTGGMQMPTMQQPQVPQMPQQSYQQPQVMQQPVMQPVMPNTGVLPAQMQPHVQQQPMMPPQMPMQQPMQGYQQQFEQQQAPQIPQVPTFNMPR
jgi:hypothetical protein